MWVKYTSPHGSYGYIFTSKSVGVISPLSEISKSGSYHKNQPVTMGKIGPLKIDVGSVQVPWWWFRVSPIFFRVASGDYGKPYKWVSLGLFSTPKISGCLSTVKRRKIPREGDFDVWKTMEMPNSRPYYRMSGWNSKLGSKGGIQWIIALYFINGVFCIVKYSILTPQKIENKVRCQVQLTKFLVNKKTMCFSPC